MEWTKKPIDADQVRSLSAAFDLDLLHATILCRRDLSSPGELSFILEDDLRFLHNPFLFLDMESFIDRIDQALAESEKVLVYGDRDVDGITSTSILVGYFQKRGMDVSWQVPMGDETYGLSVADVDRCVSDGITLIVTVDCGVTNNREIEYALENGIETLVIDHHNPEERLPPAIAIINAKIPDCGYPVSIMAGCGTAAKVIWALEFSRLDLYNQTFCLLNIRPANESYVFEAIKLVNLVEEDRHSEVLIPGMPIAPQSRLLSFLNGVPIVVWDAALQEKFLRRVFGPDTEIGLMDIKPQVGELIPALAGMSLLRVRELSRMARYRRSQSAELDVLASLFITLALKKQPQPDQAYLDVLDLVAVGTICDLMPLKNENRIIVKKGLKALNATARPGLKKLLLKLDLSGRKLTAKDVAWTIGPLINAAGRMGRPDVAVKLILSTDLSECEGYVKSLFEMNQERKKLGETAWNQALPEARKSFEEMKNKLVLVNGNQIHRGVTGIVASRLVNAFKVPAIVISHVGSTAIGSMRSLRGLNARNFLAKFESFFNDFGGHDAAAGFNLPSERVDSLMRAIVLSMDEIRLDDDKVNLEIDAELPQAMMTADLIVLSEMLEPYGEANKSLEFLCKGMTVRKCEVIDKGTNRHLSTMLEAGSLTWTAMWWSIPDDCAFTALKIGTKVDTVFKVQRNFFMNTEKIQLIISDMRLSQG